MSGMMPVSMPAPVQFGAKARVVTLEDNWVEIEVTAGRREKLPLPSGCRITFDNGYIFVGHRQVKDTETLGKVFHMLLAISNRKKLPQAVRDAMSDHFYDVPPKADWRK